MKKKPNKKVIIIINSSDPHVLKATISFVPVLLYKYAHHS